MLDVDLALNLLHRAADAVLIAVGELPAEVRMLRAHGHADQFVVDVLSDQAVRSVLSQTAVAVLSEESGFQASSGSVLTVVVDPIDGSTNCSRGVGFFGPSLAALDADGPVAAVVHNIGTGRRYAAERGGGATVNGVRIRPRSEERVSLIAAGDPCRVLERPPTPGALPVSVRVSGASAHDLCLVAEGAFDAYFDCANTQSIWDHVAASLVVGESGGIVAERDGKNLLDLTPDAKCRVVAATSRKQFEQIMAMLPHDHSNS